MNAHLRRSMAVTAAVGVIIIQSASANPTQEDPRNPKLGEEFKIKSISGVEVTAAVVARNGKQYIRSRYQHGWHSEIREYPVPSAIRSISIRGNGINLFFSAPKNKVMGVVYVINDHGEAIKVDEITQTDLTW